jgi:alpha-N-arabinofuranosidase
MAQGTHVTKNVFYENDEQDLFVEVDHGPFLVDNNLFLSKISQRSVSQGGAYVHNLFCGGTQLIPFDARMTPFMKPHSTQLAGLHNNPDGDIRFYNNLFTQAGDITLFNETTLPMALAGNVLVDGAKPCTQEVDPLVDSGFDTKIRIVEAGAGRQLEIALDKSWADQYQRKLVTTELLGKATIPDLRFEHSDGTPIRIDTDFSGRTRDPHNPFPGPFEHPAGGTLSVGFD